MLFYMSQASSTKFELNLIFYDLNQQIWLELNKSPTLDPGSDPGAGDPDRENDLAGAAGPGQGPGKDPAGAAGERCAIIGTRWLSDSSELATLGWLMTPTYLNFNSWV